MSQSIPDCEVFQRPRKARPVRIKATRIETAKLCDALEHLTAMVTDKRLNSSTDVDALATVVTFMHALRGVLPPTLLTPTGPSR
jgi:predicted metal-dependent hydrolase